MDSFIRLIADGLVPLVALVGAWALLYRLPKGSDRLKVYGRVIMAGLSALLFAKLVGGMWQPDAARPFILMGVEPGAAYLDNAGFPSDHVLFTAAITLAVWFETKNKKLTGILIVLMMLIGIGRVLALVHTPLDVIGGLAFALFGSLWYLTESTPGRHLVTHRKTSSKKSL